MKSLFRLFVFCLFLELSGIGVHAQQLPEIDYHPFLKEGKVWVFKQYVRDNTGRKEERLYKMTQSGETTIADKACARMVFEVLQEAAFEGEPEYNPPFVSGETAYYEEGAVVYSVYRHHGVLGLEPYIDFSMKLGDEVFLPEDYYPDRGVTLMVEQEDYIEVRGQTFRRLKIVSNEGSWDYWVEGIGSYRNLVLNMNLSPASPVIMPFYYSDSYVMAVYEEGELIFERDDFTTDNVVSSVSLTESDELQLMRYYDLQGRELTKAPSDGLYIERRGNTTLKVLR